MEGLGRRRATADLLAHVVLDDAMRIDRALVFDLVAQANVQARRLETEGLQVKRSAAMKACVRLEGTNEC